MSQKSKFRKPISVILALIMMMSFILPAASVMAADADEELVVHVDNRGTGTLINGIVCEQFIKKYDFEEMRSYLIEKFSTCPASVDISKYNIPTSEMAMFVEIICNCIPELFHVRYAVDFNFTQNSAKKLTTVSPAKYGYTAKGYAAKMAECKKAADKLLYGITDNDGLSELEKAVLIHDRLALNCEYATAELNSSSTPLSIYGLDGALANKRAVCNGYAIAYLYLANLAGIEAYYCPSDDLNHAWNTVYVDGELYHLDTTWDDPSSPDITGRVIHNSMLLSTNKFKSAPSYHNANDYDVRPNSTRFDNAYWINTVSSAFVYIDGRYFYVDPNSESIKITRTLLDTSDDNTVLDTFGSSNIVKLSTDGRDLYYNSSTHVFKLDMSTGTVSVFYAPTDLGSNQYIYGSRYDGKYLTLDYARSSSAVDKRVTVEILNEDCAAGNHLLKDVVPGKYSTCYACGEEVLAAPCTEHSWADVIDVEATCVKTGIKHQECTVCGEVANENTVIPTNDNHTWSWVVDKAATCGENGVQHEKCVDCSATQSEGTPLPATGIHTWKWVVDKAATCGENGMQHQQCVNCSATHNEGSIIVATGNHVWKWVVDKTATCSENGVQHQQCAYCEATQAEGTVVSATGNHTWQWVTDKNATCAEAGVKHQACTFCSATQAEGTVIPATGNHSYGAAVVVKAATCTDTGISEKTCSVCGAKTQQDIAKTDHVDNNGDGKCNACGYVMNPQVNCDCMCHKTGFMGFIYSIVKIFWKMFGTNQTCACGRVHY